MRPIEYVTHIRIETAKTLLLSFPDMPISSIAEKIGYGDPAYFAKIFKDKCGVSPSNFRAQVRSF
jgi:two-component system response regulator YesN